MSPTYQAGDYLIICKSLWYSVGNKVVFKDPIYGTIVKEIRDKRKNGYFLEGTHKNSLDSNSLGLIKKQQILGKVIYHSAKSKVQ